VGIISSLAEGNDFSAAYYLKELGRRRLFENLFERTYQRNLAAGDLWWALRSLQELGWMKEARDLLLRHKSEIMKSGNHLLLRALYAASDEHEKLKELELAEAKNSYIFDDGVVLSAGERKKPGGPKKTKRIKSKPSAGR
jgi:hypothetical protein